MVTWGGSSRSICGGLIGPSTRNPNQNQDHDVMVVVAQKHRCRVANPLIFREKLETQKCSLTIVRGWQLSYPVLTLRRPDKTSLQARSAPWSTQHLESFHPLIGQDHLLICDTVACLNPVYWTGWFPFLSHFLEWG